MLKHLTIAGVAVLATASADRPWMDKQQPPSERAKALLARMNQTEKFAMVHGYGTQPYVGNVVANARLGIPSLNLEDGPQGVADGVRLVTAWPSAMTVAAAWDVDLMEQYGAAMGKEQRLKGTNVMLGPGVNIARVPVGGRTFEYMGEDPHLASRMAFHSVKGIQSQGVIGCVKHYLNNNQEYHRGSVSEVVGEREERELYLPPFEGAVEAGVGSAMCSYNRINNTYACENPETLTNLLKGELGFQGWVMSDWGATHSTVQAANAGLDQEMPGNGFFGKALEDAVSQGKVPQQRVDDMVLRMLTPMFAVGIFDTPQTGNLSVNVTSAEHNRLAFQLAAASTILLKNERNILPLQKDKIRSIAVSGDQGTVTGGGSGGVVKPYTVTPTEGIYRIVNGAPVRPVQCTFEQNIDYYQPGNPSAHGTSAQDCCAQCTAQPGCNFFTWQPSENTCWFKATNEGRKQSNGLVSGACAPLPAGKVNVTYASSQDQAVAEAKAADVAIVNVAVTSSEGSDRADLSLGAAQDALVQAILAVQPNTIVVVRSPGAALMPWRDQAPAIIEQFMPGQESGNALAAVLFGDVNPSARLPLSFPKTADDTWLKTQEQYPGVADPQTGDIQAFYTEGLFVGYRWYDQQQLDPLFPFGHGLSYTTFQYADLKVTGSPTRSGNANVTVSFTVTNSGKQASGSEVAQLYLAFPKQADEPPQQLKRFHKTQALQPGQSETVEFTLTPRDFSIWSLATRQWQVTPGPYGVRIGASSRDIRLTATVNA